MADHRVRCARRQVEQRTRWQLQRSPARPARAPRVEIRGRARPDRRAPHDGGPPLELHPEGVHVAIGMQPQPLPTPPPAPKEKRPPPRAGAPHGPPPPHPPPPPPPP